MKKSNLVLVVFFFQTGFLVASQLEDCSVVLSSSSSQSSGDYYLDGREILAKRVDIHTSRDGCFLPFVPIVQDRSPNSSLGTDDKTNILCYGVDEERLDRLRDAGFEHFLIVTENLKSFSSIQPLTILTILEQSLYRYNKEYPNEAFDKIRFLSAYFGEDVQSYQEVLVLLRAPEHYSSGESTPE